MDSLRASDAAAAAVQKTPHRVTLDSMVAKIAGEYTFNAGDIARALALPDLPSLNVLTIHLVVMNNGFTVIGHSAPADAGNFNVELGQKLARENAIRQLWPLEGYALREQISFRDRMRAEKLFGGQQDQTAEAEMAVESGRKPGIQDLPADQQDQLETGKPIEPKPDPGSKSLDELDKPTSDEAAATAAAASGGRGEHDDSRGADPSVATMQPGPTTGA